MSFFNNYVPYTSLMGSWPLTAPLGAPGSASRFVPGALISSATILGMRKEPAAGFDVIGGEFNIYLDNQASPTPTVIGPFTGTGTLTLDEVVTQINAVVAGVASNDNGFLRLTSTTVGDDSWMYITNNNADTLQELGMFPGVWSAAGDLRQSEHPDPSRSVSMPQQYALAEGEAFSVNAINRAVSQVALNAELSLGLLFRSRLAVQKKISTTYTAPVGDPGFEVTGELVYTGISDDWAGAVPTTEELEKYFVVLDGSGRELVKENEEVLSSTAVGYYSIDAETGGQLFTATDMTFASTDPSEDYYVQSSDASLPDALEGVNLKITGYVDANTVVLAAIDPITGDETTFTAGPVAADKIEIHTVRCRVEEVQNSTGTRVEGVQEEIVAATAPSRVEKGNRVVFTGGALTSAGISEGDRVSWTGHLVTEPYSNNGEYRVGRVIDDEALELTGYDYGAPVVLNPDITSAAAGTITITTDGRFFKGPFLKFVEEPLGAIPAASQAITILYLGESSFQDATGDPAMLSPDGVRYQQEADDTVQRGLLAVMGPSATSIDEWVYDNRLINLEFIDNRLNLEHFPYDAPDPLDAGRHSDIRPDTIDMWGSVAGETVTIRGDTGETTTAKLGVRDDSDNLNFSVAADGTVTVTMQDGLGNAVSVTGSTQTTASGSHAITGTGGDTTSGTRAGSGLRSYGGDSSATLGGSAIYAVGGDGATGGGAGFYGTGGDSGSGDGGLGALGQGGQGPITAGWGGSFTGANGYPASNQSGGVGVYGLGGDAAGTGHGNSGVYGRGGEPDGIGVLALGRGTSEGVKGEGGQTSGTGVYAEGGYPNGLGLSALGRREGGGLYAEGGNEGGRGAHVVGGDAKVGTNNDGAAGVYAVGGAGDGTGDSGVGVHGVGPSDNHGVYGTTTSTTGSIAGVCGTGIGSSSDGVYGLGGDGTGAGLGVLGKGGTASSGGGGMGVRGIAGDGSTGGGTGGSFTGGDGTSGSNADGGLGVSAIAGDPNGTGVGGLAIYAYGTNGNPGGKGGEFYGGRGHASGNDGGIGVDVSGGDGFDGGDGAVGLNVSGGDSTTALAGAGIEATGGSSTSGTSGDGVHGTGGGAGAHGVIGDGVGSGRGGKFTGGATGIGVTGLGGSTSGHGVLGSVQTSDHGVWGYSAEGHGVYAEGAANPTVTGKAALCVKPQSGTPATLVDGSIWIVGGNIYARLNGSTEQLNNP